jgi:hypothetical protein
MNSSVWMAIALAAAAAGAPANDGQTITVTGCVQNFSAKGTVGTTERGYLLTNIATDGADEAKPPVRAPEGGAGGAATGTSGTAAAGMPTAGTSAGSAGSEKARAPASKAKLSYLLEGEDKELKDHVGHKVEVTGNLQPQHDEPAKTDEMHLQVASIRMLSSTCMQRPK